MNAPMMPPAKGSARPSGLHHELCDALAAHALEPADLTYAALAALSASFDERVREAARDTVEAMLEGELLTNPSGVSAAPVVRR